MYEDSERFWVGGINGLQLFNRNTNKFSNVHLFPQIISFNHMLHLFLKVKMEQFG